MMRRHGALTLAIVLLLVMGLFLASSLSAEEPGPQDVAPSQDRPTLTPDRPALTPDRPTLTPYGYRPPTGGGDAPTPTFPQIDVRPSPPFVAITALPTEASTATPRPSIAATKAPAQPTATPEPSATSTPPPPTSRPAAPQPAPAGNRPAIPAPRPVNPLPIVPQPILPQLPVSIPAQQLPTDVPYPYPLPDTTEVTATSEVSTTATATIEPTATSTPRPPTVTPIPTRTPLIGEPLGDVPSSVFITENALTSFFCHGWLVEIPAGTAPNGSRVECLLQEALSGREDWPQDYELLSNVVELVVMSPLGQRLVNFDNPISVCHLQQDALIADPGLSNTLVITTITIYRRDLSTWQDLPTTIDENALCAQSEEMHTFGVFAELKNKPVRATPQAAQAETAIFTLSNALACGSLLFILVLLAVAVWVRRMI